MDANKVLNYPEVQVAMASRVAGLTDHERRVLAAVTNTAVGQIEVTASADQMRASETQVTFGVIEGAFTAIMATRVMGGNHV